MSKIINFFIDPRFQKGASILFGATSAVAGIAGLATGSVFMPLNAIALAWTSGALYSASINSQKPTRPDNSERRASNLTANKPK